MDHWSFSGPAVDGVDYRDNYEIFEQHLDQMDLHTPGTCVNFPLSPWETTPPAPDQLPQVVPSPRPLGLLTLSPSPARLLVDADGMDIDNDDDDEEQAPGSSLQQPRGSTSGWPAADPFDPHKAAIEELYIKGNMNLKMVIENMKERHGLIASKRMYKARFERWGWHKYQSKRRQRDEAAGREIKTVTGKTCTRRPAKRRPDKAAVAVLLRRLEARPVGLLLHGNDGDSHLHILLSSTRQYLRACAESDPHWRAVDEFSSIIGYSAALEDVDLAYRFFCDGDVAVGGRLLRRACKRFEEEVVEDPLSIVSSFCLSMVELYLDRSDFGALIVKIIQHLARFTQACKRTQSHLAPILSSLSAIIQLQRQQAKHYFSLTPDVWVAEFEQLRGLNDSSTLDIINIISLNSSSTTQSTAVRKLVSGYEQLLQSARSRDVPDADLEIRLEYEILRVQYLRDIYFDGYVERVESLMASLRNRYAPSRLALNDWRIFHQELFLNCFEYLIYFHEFNTNEAGMREVATALCGELQHVTTSTCAIGTSVRVEHVLRKRGMDEEADKLSAIGQHGRVFEELEAEFVADEVEALSALQGAGNDLVSGAATISVSA